MYSQTCIAIDTDAHRYICITHIHKHTDKTGKCKHRHKYRIRHLDIHIYAHKYTQTHSSIHVYTDAYIHRHIDIQIRQTNKP